ncbi:hypothetical protein BFJ70_g17286 [Fusarium oxysporum]|nr:hypothetical protein BFJ70_g17286 [Fusarium oxysporum]
MTTLLRIALLVLLVGRPNAADVDRNRIPECVVNTLRPCQLCHRR